MQGFPDYFAFAGFGSENKYTWVRPALCVACLHEEKSLADNTLLGTECYFCLYQPLLISAVDQSAL